ncbi:hypothetical protein BUALT_Bualt05G0094700 [Buddleja alternifolia]|uniref:GRAM domain-containing protein n=1 Tax=Buddleja alternifolia TaxID=168488 RepID=A0AAV6XJU0_9LAMI|nr:hypothetical protein BUALT_Bualt05G0094700 [Buddleja alternifolia]
MEQQHNKSRFEMRNMHKERVLQFPISSADYALSSSKQLLTDSTAQNQLIFSPSRRHSKIRQCRVDSVIAKMVKLGESMDIIAKGIREHVRLSPKLSETVKGKLSLGTRILQVGGVEKVFKQKFNIRDDEKLLKASQCYLSTTAGPIAGLLFISNNRVAFCSERSIKLSSPTGEILKLHYKVVTEDNHEFWFMGFLNQQRTFKHLQQAINQAR